MFDAGSNLTHTKTPSFQGSIRSGCRRRISENRYPRPRVSTNRSRPLLFEKEDCHAAGFCYVPYRATPSTTRAVCVGSSTGLTVTIITDDGQRVGTLSTITRFPADVRWASRDRASETRVPTKSLWMRRCSGCLWALRCRRMKTAVV